MMNVLAALTAVGLITVAMDTNSYWAYVMEVRSFHHVSNLQLFQQLQHDKVVCDEIDII